MAQPQYYTYSGAFIPGTLARAEADSTEFTSVQVGFAKLAIQGVDTGAANAYSVATSGGQNGAYSDGMIVEFKATNANTASCTIAVDSGATVGLTSPSGQSLAAGAISAGTWYRAMYNSTYSAFTVVAPAAQVVTIGTISSAAPTYLVGLVSAGGVATAAAPIDATYAIDQSIAPTWTGVHTFANMVAFNSTVSFAGGLSLSGGSSQYAATLTGFNGAGHSLGLEVNAGINSSDIAFIVNSQSGGTQFLEVNGQGSVTVGSPMGGAQGVGTINAQGLYIKGIAVSTTTISSANPSATIGLAAVNGSAATFMTSDSAPLLSQAISPTWTAAHIFAPSSAVTAITVNVMANAVGMILNGGTNTSNTYLLEILTGQGSGFSSGLRIQAGTTSADAALVVENAASNTVFCEISGDGEFMLSTPTSAAKQSSGFYQIGYLDTPLNAETAASYGITMTDRGKMISTASGKTVTIPANATIAMPVGSTILVFNASTSGNATIAITTDTLLWLPSDTTGSRTLAPLSVATLYKYTATEWLIWGFGLT